MFIGEKPSDFALFCSWCEDLPAKKNLQVRGFSSFLAEISISKYFLQKFEAIREPRDTSIDTSRDISLDRMATEADEAHAIDCLDNLGSKRIVIALEQRDVFQGTSRLLEECISKGRGARWWCMEQWHWLPGFGPAVLCVGHPPRWVGLIAKRLSIPEEDLLKLDGYKLTSGWYDGPADPPTNGQTHPLTQSHSRLLRRVASL